MESGQNMERRYSASAIIYNSEGCVLVARRAETKKPYPGVLSLPSTYVKNKGGVYVSELPSELLMREQLIKAIQRKLGITINLEGIVGTKQGIQKVDNPYILTMTDFSGTIVGGELHPNGKDFSEAFHISNPAETFSGDRSKMGLCTQILLNKIDEDPTFLTGLAKS
jgi:hypothetical protein